MSETFGEKQSYDYDASAHIETEPGHAYDTDEEDLFDWQTDEPLDDPEFDTQPQRRQKLLRRIVSGIGRWPRFVRMSIVAVLGGGICLVPLIVVVCAFPDRRARPQVEVWSVWITIIWVTAVATFMVFSWIPRAGMKLAEMMTRRVPDWYADMIKVLDGAMLYVKLMFCMVWAWASLGGALAIQYPTHNANGDVLDPKPDYFHVIGKIVRSLFASSVIVLAEKIALQLVILHFHKTSLRDRVERSRLAFKVLSKLQGSRKTSGIPGASQLRSRVARFSNDARTTLGGWRSGENSGTVTPTPAAESATAAMRSRRQTFATHLQTALASAAKKAQLSDINMPESSLAARRLAKDLFMNISKNGRTISPDDFLPYFKSEKDAYQAFAIFDEDQSGEISREEMRGTLQRIFEERTMLNNSMNDMRSAFRNLDFVFLFLALIIIIFIWLIIFTGSQGVANLLPLSTIIVGFSFVFGNSAKNIFESMVFIFSTHPYDVGDLVCIGDTWMFVTAFGMISTEFVTVFNQVMIAPNAELASSKPIFNARRSTAQWDIITLQVGFETPVSKIDQLRVRLTEYCQANDKVWGGGLELLYDSVRNMNSIGLIIAVQHKNNWQDWLARWTHRTEFMRQLKTIAEELQLTYQPPQQPISFMPMGPETHPSIRYDNQLLSTMQVPPSSGLAPPAMGQPN
ncbi:hypothetical protein MOBT1_002103 [Malassezia obtusa]|uniref:EF-hand domain-containing protein n=1 Tax=Malassezia obtusa TaxID=76774 RepID=A0AAF0E0I1_9BASI|nr:hypothetical protein MOBT1_002103 [Malassezia obtusa]